MADYTRALKKELSSNGYSFKRHGKGDHDIWYSPLTNKTLVIDSKIKSRDLANAILKQAGISKKF